MKLRKSDVQMTKDYLAHKRDHHVALSNAMENASGYFHELSESLDDDGEPVHAKHAEFMGKHFGLVSKIHQQHADYHQRLIDELADAKLQPGGTEHQTSNGSEVSPWRTTDSLPSGKINKNWADGDPDGGYPIGL